MDDLAEFLRRYGYDRIMTNLPEFVFFYKPEMQGVTVLLLIDYRAGNYITSDQYDHIKESICQLFAQRGQMEIHILSLILCSHTQNARLISGSDRFCWLLDDVQNRLIIYENQVNDFYGMRAILEKYLKERETDPVLSQTAADEIKRKLPWVTIFLVAANVLLFLICTWGTDLLYNIGSLVGPAILERREYYRIFLSMFLHADVSHIFSNMLILYFVGQMIEEELGHIRYAVLYFLSGLSAAMVSLGYQYAVLDFRGSIGASGAIYGILGALLWQVIKNRKNEGRDMLPRFLIFLCYSLYSGFRATNVDNAAHIGGLLWGFILMIILQKRRKLE